MVSLRSRDIGDYGRYRLRVIERIEVLAWRRDLLAQMQASARPVAVIAESARDRQAVLVGEEAITIEEIEAGFAEDDPVRSQLIEALVAKTDSAAGNDQPAGD